MAALALPIISSVVSAVAPHIPEIIALFQHAHPIPPVAPQQVKDDLNALKAAGAQSVLAVLVNQLAAAGKIPAAASDPNVMNALAGAIEQEYQSMKASGALNEPAIPATVQAKTSKVTITGVMVATVP